MPTRGRALNFPRRASGNSFGAPVARFGGRLSAGAFFSFGACLVILRLELQELAQDEEQLLPARSALTPRHRIEPIHPVTGQGQRDRCASLFPWFHHLTSHLGSVLAKKRRIQGFFDPDGQKLPTPRGRNESPRSWAARRTCCITAAFRSWSATSSLCPSSRHAIARQLNRRTNRQ